MAASEPPALHSFPAGHALRVVALVRRWQVDPSELLGPHGLDEAALLEPNARIEADALAAILRRARQLTGEPGLGFYLGLDKRMISYGQLGIATLSASTLREALQLVVDLSAAVSTGISLDLRTEGELAALVVTEHVDFGDVADIAALGFYVGVVQNNELLTGKAFDGVTELTIPEPDYYPRFAHLLPNARFGQPQGQILFPVAYLDLPLPNPDPIAVSLARRECERTMESLGFERSLPGRVRQEVLADDHVRTVEQVAARLHVSTRTLKRRLQSQGQSFTELRDEERRQRALHLLRSSDLSVEAIGLGLGYSTLPNFARAFRRWTGHSPSEYRLRNRRR